MSETKIYSHREIHVDDPGEQLARHEVSKRREEGGGDVEGVPRGSKDLSSEAYVEKETQDDTLRTQDSRDSRE